MQLVCLDLEGVLVPEIWIEFSERTGIPELRRTTRDEPDYDKLMKYRLACCAAQARPAGHPEGDRRHGADGRARKDFLDELRERFQVIILSDTFYEFAMPLMRQLGMPTLFCHKLEADADGFLVNYQSAHAGPEDGIGQALQGTQLQGHRRRRFLQRHGHARRSPRRHPVPPAGERHPRVPAVSGDHELRRTARRDRQGVASRRRI